jgi:hypothetical protein
VDHTKPWDFLMGHLNKMISICGGGVIFFKENHSFRIKMGLGPELQQLCRTFVTETTPYLLLVKKE